VTTTATTTMTMSVPRFNVSTVSTVGRDDGTSRPGLIRRNIREICRVRGVSVENSTGITGTNPL
jgi:hypothetical protein